MMYVVGFKIEDGHYYTLKKSILPLFFWPAKNSQFFSDAVDCSRTLCQRYCMSRLQRNKVGIENRFSYQISSSFSLHLMTLESFCTNG